MNGVAEKIQKQVLGKSYRKGAIEVNGTSAIKIGKASYKDPKQYHQLKRM